MDTKLRPVTVAESRQASARLQIGKRGGPIRTPLIKATFSPPEGPEIWLKLENLQSIGSFKIRGAGNALALEDETELIERGVATASAGNMGQGVAYCASQMGAACTVVVPENAPQTKTAAVERLGAKVIRVPYDEWWNIIETGECEERCPGMAFVHPVLDQRVMEGNGTIGLEIWEDLPDLDAVVVPYGGGALTCGVGAVLKEASKKHVKVYGSEPETAAPLHASFRAGECSQAVNYRPSFVDGCGGKACLPPIWEVAKKVVDDGIAVPLPDIANAIRLLAERHRVIAEGAGASSVAAALSGKAGRGKVVCVVSGGGLDSSKLSQILAGCPSAAGLGKATAGCPMEGEMSVRNWKAAVAMAALMAFTAGFLFAGILNLAFPGGDSGPAAALPLGATML